MVGTCHGCTRHDIDLWVFILQQPLQCKRGIASLGIPIKEHLPIQRNAFGQCPLEHPQDHIAARRSKRACMHVGVELRVIYPHT